MLGFKDFFHMPQIDRLIDQLVHDRPGLILVAGLEPRRFPSGEEAPRRLASGKSAILRILMREILEANPRERCIVFVENGDGFRIPRELRARTDVFQTRVEELRPKWLNEAVRRRPGLLVLEQLSVETLPTAIEAARRGVRVLTQVDTIFRGAGVARFLESQGMTHDHLDLLRWVISVLRLPVLCPACKQPIPADENLLVRLGLPQSDMGVTFYRASGCLQCKGVGRQGEVSVFDFFQADAAKGDLFNQPSLLPAREYLAYLAGQGQLAPEDALDLDAYLLHDTYSMLVAEEKALLEANKALHRKVLELEVSNRILVQRTEAVISFQEIGQTLINSASLVDLASRICRYTRDLCGSDRIVVYFNRSETTLEVLASGGWEKANPEEKVPADLLPAVPETGEMRPFLHVPPGINLANDPAPIIRAGFYVPLVVDSRAVGRMVVQSTSKTAFNPGEISMLRTFANQAALAMQRADLVDQLRAKIMELEAAQVELVKKERIEHELELARQVQQSVLPRNFPQIRGFEFAALNLPARQVGGDFYDVIRIDDDHFGAVVADVSDKGMPAALYMALARSLILAEGHRSLSPRQVLENVNRLLMELGEPGMFVTVFYAVVDCRSRTMTYTRAGHDRPVILRKGELLQLGGQGMALGVMNSEPFILPEEEISLQEGDRLLMFSDGLVDALGKDGARYTLSRLHNFWQKLPLIPVKDVCSLTFEVLAGYQEGAEQSDDMTLLAIGVV